MNVQGYKDHKSRGLLLQYISDNPGASFVLLKDVFKMTDGTLRYHLDYLQKKRRIALEKHGGKRCYYPFIRKCYPYSEGSIELNEEQQRLLDIIATSPGVHFSVLKKRSGLGNGTFVYNLNRLKERKLIWRRRGEGGLGYEVITRERIADEVFLSLVNRFLDGELDKDSLNEMVDRLETYRKER